jgi:hypothetical protein
MSHDAIHHIFCCDVGFNICPANANCGERAIERLLARGLVPSLIVILHRLNAAPPQLEKLIDWFRKLERLGIRRIGLHLLEVENQDAREKYARSVDEMVHALRRLREARVQLATLQWRTKTRSACLGHFPLHSATTLQSRLDEKFCLIPAEPVDGQVFEKPTNQKGNRGLNETKELVSRRNSCLLITKPALALPDIPLPLRKGSKTENEPNR